MKTRSLSPGLDVCAPSPEAGGAHPASAEDSSGERIIGVVGHAAERLLNRPQWTDEIPGILRCLGEATDANRVCLFRRVEIAADQGEPAFWEWGSDGVEPMGADRVAGLFARIAETAPALYADLAAGRSVGGKAEELPEPVRQILDATHVAGFTAVPVFVDGGWWGCLGIGDCRTGWGWSSMETDALTAVAHIIGAAIRRVHLEDLFRLPVSATSSGICLFRGETICFVNPAFTELFDYTPEEAVGNLKVSEIFHPDDRERFRRTTEQILSGAIVSVHERYGGVRKDGSRLCLDYIGLGTRYHGEPAVVGLFFDRTAQKKAEDALRGSEEKFRAIFDRVNDAIFLIELTPHNRPGRLIEVNRAACTSLHYCREELLNVPVGDVEEPGAGTVLADIMERLLMYGTAKYEAVELRKDGTPLAVEVNSHLCDIDGKPVILAVARDISERKERQRMEAEAFGQIEENMEQFAILNDHIRNPLQVILGLADLYDEAVAEKIRAETGKIDTLINSLDQGWLRSEKIRRVLRRHYGLFREPDGRH